MLLGNLFDGLIFLASQIAIYGLVVYILIQVLIQFEIIPRHNQPARQVWGVLDRIYDPLLRPFRRYLPLIGGFDLSPLGLIFSIMIVRYFLILSL